MPSEAKPLGDLDAYLALPRTAGLTLSRDGTRLVTTVSSLDPERTRYVSALWEVDPAGARPATRLTRSAKGETAAAFASNGDLLFTSARPDPDTKAEDGDDPKAALWLLPAAGGEARVIATAGGGLGNILTARDADVVSVSAQVLPSATDLEAEADLRKARSTQKVSAILHSGYPIRHWDHDLGPEEPRRYVASLGSLTDAPARPVSENGESATDAHLALRQLTGAGRQLSPEHQGALSADGTTLVTTWAVVEAGASVRSTLVALDTATGERRTLLDDPDHEYEMPAISPDGRYLVYLHYVRSTPETAPDCKIGLLALDGHAGPRVVAAGWDRWPTSFTWLPDSSGVLITADSDGRGPIFWMGLDDVETVHRVTADDALFSSVCVAPDGSTAYALRSSYAAPHTPVRIDLAEFWASNAPVPAARLLGPVPEPDLPGTLTEVETEADDGVRVRAWLAVPAGASDEAPAPLLLWIHGGPLGSWNDWSWRWNPWLLVAQGYAVLLPDPALSTGYGRDFVQRGWGRWGERPFTDLMAITDAVEARPEIDETRTAAMGGSFGGYMANWVAGHTDRFDAIVTHASLWEMDGFGTTTDHAYYWGREMTPEMALANSPHRFVDKIATPILVIHGDKDYRVPIGEGLRLWQELLTKSALPAAEDGSTVHRFLYFPDENHWVLSPQHAKVWYQVVTAYLAEHVLGEAGEWPEVLG
ncbi:S9 family peptidase [Nocardioides limicola]|uniref:S9 family peptidase n=1 Tax=Nocardioides limicola TaxID=2803368 RepID=UPI00193C1461|nr:prolyl oligopeptidase family serine peptidase [Nocardioides sp. DJM-14]